MKGFLAPSMFRSKLMEYLGNEAWCQSYKLNELNLRRDLRLKTKRPKERINNKSQKERSNRVGFGKIAFAERPNPSEFGNWKFDAMSMRHFEQEKVYILGSSSPSQESKRSWKNGEFWHPNPSRGTGWVKTHSTLWKDIDETYELDIGTMYTGETYGGASKSQWFSTAILEQNRGRNTPEPLCESALLWGWIGDSFHQGLFKCMWIMQSCRFSSRVRTLTKKSSIICENHSAGAPPKKKDAVRRSWECHRPGAGYAARTFSLPSNERLVFFHNPRKLKIGLILANPYDRERHAQMQALKTNLTVIFEHKRACTRHQCGEFQMNTYISVETRQKAALAKTGDQIFIITTSWRALGTKSQWKNWGFCWHPGSCGTLLPWDQKR